MAATRRPVISVLTLQGASLVVLSAVAAAWVWRAADTRAAIVRAPRRAIEAVRAESYTIVVAPYAYLQTRDRQHLDEMQQAVADARAEVKNLRVLVPGSADSVDQASGALTQLITNAGQVYNATESTDLSASLEEMELARAVLEASLVKLDSAVERRAQRHYQDATDGLLVLWGCMLIVTLATTLVARRRVLFNEQRGGTARKHLLDNVGVALQQATAGADENRPPEFVEAPEYGPLTEAAAAAIREMQRLRTTNAQMAKSSSFTQDLIDALGMAETEDEVLRTGVRAARVAYPDAEFHLTLVDEDSGELSAYDQEADTGVSAFKAEDCPAFRKGRTVFHDAGVGITRCPVCQSGEACVACAVIQVNGRTTALAHLVGYEPEQTQFEYLEALGLAVGARLGVVRNLARRAFEAGTDPLTGLANRRMLSDRLDRLDRSDTSYAVVVADIDHFKQLNDTHGHEAGDRCLEIFAGVMREACRDSDLPARIGGEEFVIV
ncbi:MAG: GGDEF domain-containing protein, partial [Myxococcota bacterium]|nr:GGDEF domain-containing protein [Myxococcota bacterium]